MSSNPMIRLKSLDSQFDAKLSNKDTNVIKDSSEVWQNLNLDSYLSQYVADCRKRTGLMMKECV